MKLFGLFSIVATTIGCLESAAVLRGAQDAPDLCASIIAIALTRDPSDPTHRHLSSDSDEEFVCERSDTGEFIPLVGTPEQIDQLRNSLNYGDFVSAETTIAGLTEADLVSVEVPGAGGGNAFAENSTAFVEEAVSLPLGALTFKPGNGRHSLRKLAAAGAEDDQSRRHLATYLGDKKVLFVKVTDVNGLAHPDNANTISDKIFGTSGDSTTMASQFSDCSFGKMTISNNRVNLGNKAAAPGVIEVRIDISLTDSGRNAVKNAAVKAVEAKLGYSIPGPFDHVMFGVEKCYLECGWAAYAGVNSWFSVYQGNNYKYPAVSLHEVGHNLNLAHSGDGVAEYKDHSCLMGNPWFRDDVDQMCYNPAKSYQIRDWYADRLDYWNSGNTGSNRIVKKIIGIADYGNNPQSRPVVVKLESGTENDLFIGFNRKRGINSASKMGNDQVTVIEQGRDGNGYSKSVFLSGLSAGQSYTKSNWQGSGKNMVIRVLNIDTSSNPWTAEVEFNFNNAAGTPPTPNPAPLPTTLTPTLQPVTASPTRKCGNNICELNENAYSCSEDCFDASFYTYTDNIGAKQANGTMFTVQALRDVEITDIRSFIRVDSANADVEVYTRPGSYNGFEGSDAGWDLVYSNETFIEGQNELTEFAFNKKVKVLAGQYRSFYVYSPSNLKYREESVQEGALVLSDQSFNYFAGIAIAFGQFGDGQIYSPRVFSGVLTYTVPAPPCGNGTCDANENSSVCSVDCSGLEYGGTQEDAANGAEGIMFRVKALRDLTVISFEVYGSASGTHPFQVYTRSGDYTGHESSQAGWSLAYDNASLQLNGKDTLSSEAVLSTRVSIPAGTEVSFYLYTPSKLMYAPGTGASPYSSNGDLEFYEGSGIYGGIFANTITPRVFAGMIRYDVTAPVTPTTASPVTAPPTKSPSKKPTSQQTNPPTSASPVTAPPTRTPSKKPTPVPSTRNPTPFPTKKPTAQPTFACNNNGTCEASETATTCSQDCANLSLNGTSTGIKGARGVMFELKAERDVTVKSFSFYTDAARTGLIEVYTRVGTYQGNELSSAGWSRIYSNSNVQQNGRDVLTSLGNFNTVVTIPKGSRQSFYIWTPNYVMYDDGGVEAAVLSQDASLVLYRGIGISGDPFIGTSSNLYRPRIYKGTINYDAISISNIPTMNPVTSSPTKRSSLNPTQHPVTPVPSKQPTQPPTYSPSVSPTKKPTAAPTTSTPTRKPTNNPTSPPPVKPTTAPSKQPTQPPTRKPSVSPTKNPTYAPSKKPTAQPTNAPTRKPSAQPTNAPSKQPTNLCSNGTCDANENSSVCSVDCSGLEYGGTQEDATNGAEGIMFRVKALRDLTVISFEVYGSASGTHPFQVYTRSGDYTGHESSQAGWSLAYDNASLQLNGRDTLSSEAVLSTRVSIPAGTEVSFYLYTPSKLMYAPGTGASPYSSNGDLEFYEGSGIYGGIFANSITWRVFAGMIRYDVTAPVTPTTASPVTAPPTKSPSKKPTSQQTNPPTTRTPSKKPTPVPSTRNPTPFPTKKPTAQPTFACNNNGTCEASETATTCSQDCANLSLNGTSTGIKGARGVMFELKAERDVTVKSFSFYTDAARTGLIEVYTRVGTYQGNELSSAGWSRIYSNSNVQQNGRDVLTSLGNFNTVVTIPKGSRQSFYIWTPNYVMYDDGGVEAAVLSQDASLVLYRGIGISGDPFIGTSSNLYRPRIYKGYITYDAGASTRRTLLA